MLKILLFWAFLLLSLVSSAVARILPSNPTLYFIPTITQTGTLDPLSTIYGASSFTDFITVSGTDLLAGITAIAPAGYEISTSATSGFQSTLTLGSAGTISPTNLYIRISALTNASPSAYTGTISLSSTGAATVYSPVISGVVNPHSVGLYLRDIIKNYGDSFGTGTATGYVPTGANGEYITSVTITSDAAASSSNTSAGSTYTISMSDAQGTGSFKLSNYSINYRLFTGIVQPLTVYVVANNLVHTYGSPLPAGPGSTAFIAYSMANGETIGSVTLNLASGNSSTDGVNSYSNSATVSNATGGSYNPSNYTLIYLNGNLDVTPAPLTITGGVITKVYGTTLVNNAGSTSFLPPVGLVNRETIGSVSMTYGTGTAGNAPVGTYGTSANPGAALATSGGSFNATNYAIRYIAGAIVVVPKPLTITATGPLKSYGQQLLGLGSTTQFVVTAMATGESITSTGYTVSSAGQSSASSAGTGYTVTPLSATGAGGYIPANYTVNYIPFTGTVSPASLVISALPATKIYGSSLSLDPASKAFTQNGLMNQETVTSVSLFYTGGTQATAPVKVYPAAISVSTPIGAGFTASNYAITYLPAALTVMPASLTISALPLQKTYGSLLLNSPLSTTFVSLGMKNNETIGMVNALVGAGASASSPVGSYPGSSTLTSATGGSFQPSNYTISYLAASITVSPASLSVLANDLYKTYGGLVTDTASSPGYTLSGMQNGERAGAVSLAFGTGASAAAGVGTHAGSVVASGLTGGNFQASNYTLQYYPGNIVISPAPLVISPADVTKLYGVNLSGSTASAKFSASGFKNAETAATIILTYGPGASAASLPGTYDESVLAGNLSGGNFNPANYTISYLPARLTVGTDMPLVAVNSQPDCSTALGSFTIQNYNAAFSYSFRPSAGVKAAGSSFTAPAGTYTLIATAPQSVASPASLAFTINQQPPVPVLMITSPAEVEAPATVDITSNSVTASSSPNLTFSYFMDASAARPLMSPGTVSISGIYYIRAINSAGCSSPLKAVYVSINPLPVLVIVNPPAVNDPSTVDITSPAVTAGSSPGLIYTYYADAAGTLPVTNPGSMRISGVYYIKGTNAGGNFLIKKVIVTIDYQIYIPNVFTPNGDGKNDRFEVTGIVHFPGSSLTILNQWGHEVYHSVNYQNTWTGSDQVPGTYYYALTLNNKGSTKVYKGWVQILH